MEFKGIAVSPGCAIGRALVLPPREPLGETARRAMPAEANGESSEREAKRLKLAVHGAATEIIALVESAASDGRTEQARILATQLALLEDPEYVGEAERRIRDESLAAEAAVSEVTDELVFLFGSMDNERLKERCADLRDVAYRLQAQLAEEGSARLPFSDWREEWSGPVILIGADIPPSVTASLGRGQAAGFAACSGGRTSHSAIIARSLGIPAVVGLPENALEAIKSGMPVVLDGNAAIVRVNPDTELVEAYRRLMQREAEETGRLERFKELPTATADGHRVHLAINIAAPAEAKLAMEVGAEGIGLYRTEFLFMGREEAPGEEEQFAAYRAAVQGAGGRGPVTIRTLDIGGDKEAPYLNVREEANPFLGFRAIRICLHEDYRELFKEQLRAILRASAYGSVELMYPMISTLGELREANRLLAEAKAELDAAGTGYDRLLKVGVMIEVPAAVLIADQLAKEADFFSIGTNDLVQYAMAADRMNDRVASLAQPMQPAILRLIERTVEAAHRQGKRVGMCGEIAGQLPAIPLLLGLGLDELSMSPSALLPARELISRLSASETRAAAQAALRMESAEEVAAMAAALVGPLFSK